MKKLKKEPAWLTLLIFLLTAVGAFVWTYLYVTRSKFIYSWDNTLYWSAAKSLSDFKFDRSLWDTFLYSVANDEYNIIPSLLPALAMKIFGKGRLVFILSTTFFYFIPLVSLIFSMSKKYFSRPGLCALGIVLSLPIMLFIGLVGFVDLGGVFFALLAMRIYFSEKKNIFSYLAIGVLLVLSMLFRRYFAFFAFSFAVMILGDAILFGKKKARIFAMFVLMGGILFFGFRGFLFNQLLRDYGNLYSGYKFSLKTDFLLLSRYFGIIPTLALAVISVYVGRKEKNFNILFLWIQILLCFTMFVLTQTHGQQHLLLYVPSVIMLIFQTVPKISDNRIKICLAVLSVLITGNTLIDRMQPNSLSEIKYPALIPNFSTRARVRKDAEDVLALKQYLNETVGLDKKVGVLASSLDLNEDILRNCEESLGLTAEREDFFVSLPAVDSRDRDFSTLFEADYMVVAYPVQTHLGEDKQQIITNAVKMFSEQKGFAAAFVPIGEEFKVGNISVYVYKRTRPVSATEKSEFLSLFT